eukprot:2123834-Rhodomonas_salina.1
MKRSGASSENLHAGVLTLERRVVDFLPDRQPVDVGRHRHVALTGQLHLALDLIGCVSCSTAHQVSSGHAHHKRHSNAETDDEWLAHNSRTGVRGSSSRRRASTRSELKQSERPCCEQRRAHLTIPGRDHDDSGLLRGVGGLRNPARESERPRRARASERARSSSSSSSVRRQDEGKRSVDQSQARGRARKRMDTEDACAHQGLVPDRHARARCGGGDGVVEVFSLEGAGGLR